MKSCSDCQFLITLRTKRRICSLKSFGRQRGDSIVYFDAETTSVLEERQDSKGFLGFFRDNTRCGTSAKNFEPVNKP